MVKKNKNKSSEDDKILSDIFTNLENLYDELYYTDTNIINFNDNLTNFVEKLSNRENSNTKAEIEEFKELIKKEIMEGIKTSIRRGYYPDNTIIDANTSATKELEKSISEIKKSMEDTLSRQLQEVDKKFTELMDKRQEVERLQKEIESWQGTAVEFFQYIERTIDNISKSNDENSLNTQLPVYEKVLKDFERYVNLLGLQKICPKSSEDVNEKLHKVVAEKESEEVQAELIIECQKWGYTINGQRYGDKYAKVIVAKSPEQNKNANQDGESEPENSESSNSIKNDSQALAQNSETPDDNNALESGSVNDTNEPNETSLNQHEITKTDENDSSSDSNLNKLEEEEKNNLQSSQAEHTPTSE